MGYKALIADDNPRNIVILKGILNSQGFTVYSVNNGLQIFEVAKKVMPDIILLDIVMPEMDGFETCARLKSDFDLKDIPVIMVTQKTNGEDIAKALDLGAFDYIKKPIDELEAIARIQSALRYKSAQDQMRELAMKDGLTGLYNHNFLIEILEKEYQKQLRKGDYITYAMLDIDNFKKINDTYGHLHGDEILKQIAILINNSIRISDTVGRYGGEEFGILLTETTPNKAFEICDKIRNNIEYHKFEIDGNDTLIHVTASIGIFSGNASLEFNVKKIIKAADEALYIAKENGRNKAIMYNSENCII